MRFRRICAFRHILFCSWAEGPNEGLVTLEWLTVLMRKLLTFISEMCVWEGWMERVVQRGRGGGANLLWPVQLLGSVFLEGCLLIVSPPTASSQREQQLLQCRSGIITMCWVRGWECVRGGGATWQRISHQCGLNPTLVSKWSTGIRPILGL